MDPKQKFDLLRSLTIFRLATDEVLVELAKTLNEQKVEAGTLVIKKGDVGTKMYIIAEGRMRVFDGEQFLGEIGSKEIFGELAALSSQKRLASVAAIEDSLLLTIDKEVLYGLISGGGGIVNGIIEELCARVHRIEGMQMQLILQEKLASIGLLSMGIAHELKNPLNFVLNFSEMSVESMGELKEIYVKDPANRERILPLLDYVSDLASKILNHGQRADSIIKRLLSHAHSGAVEPINASLIPLLERSLGLALQAFRHKVPAFDVEISRNYDVKNRVELMVFPEDLMRVFINIIDNACFAMHKHALENSKIKPSLSIELHDELGSVRILFKDNGGGIAIDNMRKLFQPFFTTKPPGEGTGMGLSISYDIIKQHGGNLKVDTDHADFTQFEIILPKRGAKIKSSGDLS